METVAEWGNNFQEKGIKDLKDAKDTPIEKVSCCP